MIYSNRELSQKIERTEARANASFVEARAEISPEANAEWIEVAGAYAMFDGIESPLTQTFGLGIFEEITSEHLDRIEAFFNKHDAPIFHEVSPLTDVSLMNLLIQRGYQPCELTSVLYQELENKPNLPINPNIKTRIIEPDEAELWAQVSANGWATEMEGLAEFMFNFGKISANTKGGFPYLAELNSQPIATGMLFIYDDVAILAGASTMPEARGQGAQNALLEARLRFAAENGCKIAIMGASPGSISQRNAEKNGFRIAYTRTKWALQVKN